VRLGAGISVGAPPTSDPALPAFDRRHRQAMAAMPRAKPATGKSILPSVSPLRGAFFLHAFLQLAAAAWRSNVRDALVNRSGED
jgi:hypothetical protein